MINVEELFLILLINVDNKNELFYLNNQDFNHFQ